MTKGKKGRKVGGMEWRDRRYKNNDVFSRTMWWALYCVKIKIPLKDNKHKTSMR